MCEAFRQMREKYTKIGREEGICSSLKMCKEFGVSKEEAVERVVRDFSIEKEEVERDIEKF